MPATDDDALAPQQIAQHPRPGEGIIEMQFVEAPHQGRTLHFSDPAGTPVELCATMPVVPRMHTKKHMHRGAAALRMDHYQVLVPDVMTTAKFYLELGFRISDYIVIESAGKVVGTFLHRKDNPWDIVFLQRSGPRFHHGGYVVESFSDIQAMSRPPTTRPPEACSAMPPMPRRFSIAVATLPARSSRKTPPFITSLK